MTLGVEENVIEKAKPPHLHARTEYDNISPKDLTVIKEWLLKEGAALHKRARTFISNFDLDINPDKEKKGGSKVVVGTFSYTSRRSRC